MNLTFLLLSVKFLLFLYVKNCRSIKFSFVADSTTFKIDEFVCIYFGSTRRYETSCLLISSLSCRVMQSITTVCEWPGVTWDNIILILGELDLPHFITCQEIRWACFFISIVLPFDFLLHILEAAIIFLNFYFHFKGM